MWIKTQNGKTIVDCIGFEIGFQGYGNPKNIGVDIYGIISNSKDKILIGSYEQSKANVVLEQLEQAIINDERIFEMPSC